MHNKAYIFLAALAACACTRPSAVSTAGWRLSYDKGVDIVYRGDTIAKGSWAEYALNGDTMKSGNYEHTTFKKQRIDDRYGRGVSWTLTISGRDMPQLVRTFRLYDGFMLTDIALETDSAVSTSYMAPLVTRHTGDMIKAPMKRAVFVPYDNDKWIRYASSSQAGDSLRSYEVTCVYDPEGRQGLVAGAIEHDTWKNAVELTDGRRSMKLYSGVADELTRDVKGHGAVRSARPRSAVMMLGCYDDWRDGMEHFADLNAVTTPPRRWDSAVPVGWNSWGALQFGVNHDNATEVATFLADSLMPRSFHNADGLIYTGLDSGWDSFKETELKDFADRCKAMHQVPCIYWTPFTDWAKNPERQVDAMPEYKYKDIYLYADGKPQELDGAYAIDPTHPAVRAMMEKTARLFRRCGYRYVKMDFMTHGRMEADSWHRKDITTGTQAYNYGMHLIDSIFSDMYINLSISPLFPAQYAQSRRIACDAWNKIKDTEYTMNALTWGWWLDRVYSYNDADHVVLRDATEGENHARVTSAVITGMFITGDDFSIKGDSTAKARAVSMLGNERVNALIDGRAFRPLNADDDRSEHMFVRAEQDGRVCLAVFNYGDEPMTFSLPVERLPMQKSTEYKVQELWSGETVDSRNSVTLPSKDAMIFVFRPE